METSRKSPLTLSSLILLCLILVFSSCSSTEEEALVPTNNTERTDIVIAGDLQLSEFNVSTEWASSDLISYNYYGNNAPNFDFIVRLSSGYTLTIMMYDAARLNPQEQVNQPYNIYPGQDLDDKLYYTNITLKNSDGITEYSTNEDDNIPPGYLLDVFKVIKNNGDQIQCRIRDMILYKQNDPDKTVHINGTFIGFYDLG